MIADRSPTPPARPLRWRVAPAVAGLRAAAERLARVVPGRGLMGAESPGGPQSRRRGPDSFFARISGSANPYSFVEAYGSGSTGDWTALANGRTGSDAYELNGATGLGGKVVEVTPVAAGAWHRFAWKQAGEGRPCRCDFGSIPSTIDLTVNAGSSAGYASTTLTFGPNPLPIAAPAGWWSPLVADPNPYASFPFDYRYLFIPCFAVTVYIHTNFVPNHGWNLMPGVYFLDPTATGNSCSPLLLMDGTKFMIDPASVVGFLDWEFLNCTVSG